MIKNGFLELVQTDYSFYWNLTYFCCIFAYFLRPNEVFINVFCKSIIKHTFLHLRTYPTYIMSLNVERKYKKL